ncbi:hypothetical protein QJS10_CPA06g00948 [Acorus calamus]|uniref:Uncharacterized protein n=1 Tax=Acorus calamus TaxID=4465 RepID=A0AAV9EH29_ACOCL|nr:hypothetical protein QJS10_CPA06g00948 [Acorus calamus]
MGAVSVRDDEKPSGPRTLYSRGRMGIEPRIHRPKTGTLTTSANEERCDEKGLISSPLRTKQAMERFHEISRLLLISVVLINGIVGGNAHSKTNTEIDQYLMNLNKPAIKTIHVYARIYPDYREVPKPLYGTKGAINIWNVHVEPNEWSQSLFVVGNMDGLHIASLKQDIVQMATIAQGATTFYAQDLFNNSVRIEREVLVERRLKELNRPAKKTIQVKSDHKVRPKRGNALPIRPPQEDNRKSQEYLLTQQW